MLRLSYAMNPFYTKCKVTQLRHERLRDVIVGNTAKQSISQSKHFVSTHSPDEFKSSLFPLLL